MHPLLGGARGRRIVSAVFQAFELFADSFLSWLPTYYWTKFFVLVWMQHPSLRGAYWFYMTTLRPFLLRNQVRIDEGLVGAQRRVSTTMTSAQEAFLIKVRRRV